MDPYVNHIRDGEAWHAATLCTVAVVFFLVLWLQQRLFVRALTAQAESFLKSLSEIRAQCIFGIRPHSQVRQIVAPTELPGQTVVYRPPAG